MESFSYFFRSSVPGYFQALPLPSSLVGFGSLSAKEWLQLVPFFASLGLAGYISYKEIDYYLKYKQNAWINKDLSKDRPKINDLISKDEINAAIDKNDKVSYCRCWRSKKFPYCDGAHNKHNTETGDNVGPLTFKR